MADRVLIYPALQGPVLTTAQRPEAVTEDRWHQPFSEPSRNFAARRAAGYAVALIASGAIGPVLTTAQFPETVTESRWHQPFSEPVRVKPGLHASRQQATIWSGFTPAVAETITVDKWFAPLAEPVRVRRFNVALQQSATIDPRILTQPEAVNIQWLVPLSEPVRRKIGLPAAAQLFAAMPATVPSAETVTLDKWFAAFSEPTRRKPTVPGHIALDPFPNVSFGWDQPLSQPRFAQPPLRQQFFDVPAFTAAPETVTIDKWHAPYALPVWRKPALLAALQQSATIDPVALTIPGTVVRTTTGVHPVVRKRYILPNGKRFFGTTGELQAHLARLPRKAAAQIEATPLPSKAMVLDLPDIDELPAFAPRSYRLTPDDVSLARLRALAESEREKRDAMRMQTMEDDALALLLTTLI